MLSNASEWLQLPLNTPACSQMHPNAWIHLKWPLMRKNIIGGGLVDSVFVVAYHTYHTYILTYLPYGMYRMMPSPTDSPNVVVSYMVSMYSKLTVLTILTILTCLPHNTGYTEWCLLVQSHLMSSIQYGKRISQVCKYGKKFQIFSYALQPGPCYSYIAQQQDS